MIAFAAKAGSTASDGGGENGPIAKALVDNLPRPGLDLRLAFGYVRDAVLKNTGYQQEPYVYGSLGGDKVSLVPVKPIDTGPKPNPQDDIRKDYELTLQLGTRDAWNVFVAHYPDGFYADLARVQLNKIVAEEVRAAAEEKARVAEEKARLAAEGGKQAEQEKATAAAKAAKEARLAAEKAKQIEQAKAEAAEQARAAAEKAASQIAAAETAEADRKTTEQAAAEKAVVEARDRQAASEHTLSATAQHEKEVQKLAALPPREAETSLAPISAKNIAKSVQLQLQRVGCLSGEANGDWNIASQRSLAQFNKYAGTKFDIKAASIDALDAVSAKTGRVCPLVCDRGYRADRESCVKITCRADQILNGDGECEQQRKHESLVSKGDQFPSGKPDKAGPKQQTGGRCTSVSQRCAIQIGGRCNPSTGHWEYGRNGAGGSKLAFNNCVGQMLAGSKR
jgi:hypothetical protein